MLTFYEYEIVIIGNVRRNTLATTGRLVFLIRESRTGFPITVICFIFATPSTQTRHFHWSSKNGGANSPN